MTFELRPHQEVAVGKMSNGCILCGGVGVGKTHTAIQYYLNNEAPKPVYVITTAKKRDKGDWQDIFAEVGMHKNPEWTMGAVVIVDSWENIKKYEGVEGAFFIFDEQRLVGTGAWVKAFYKIAKANRWIMLSATPGDNWLDYVPVFRANGLIKNITAFKEDHVVQRWTGRYYQVVGYRQVPKLVRWRNQLLVDMPYEKHTTRHTHEVEVEYDQELVRRLVDKRWHVYEDRPLTDASELFRVMRKVVYSDASRLAAIRRLIQTHPKLIVFYNFDYELEILRTLSNSDTTQSISSKEVFSQDQTKTSASSEKHMSSPSVSTKSPTLSAKDSTSQSSTSSQTEIPEASPETIQTLGSPGLPEPSTKSRSSSEASSTQSRTTRKVSGSKNASIDTSGLSVDPRLLPSSQTSSTSISPARKESDSSWDYLLSPQGMAENDRLIGPPTRSTESGSWTTDEGKGEVWIPETCPTKEALQMDDEAIMFERKLSSEASTLFEKTQRESLQPESSQKKGSDSWTDSNGTAKTLRTGTESSQLQTSGSMSAREDLESPYETHVESAQRADSKLQTPEKSGGQSESGSSSRMSSSKKDSKPIRTGLSTHPPINKESEECQKQKKMPGESRRMPTRTSTLSGSPDDTSRINDDVEKLLELKRKMSSERSSAPSKPSSGLSSTGRSSTSLPQFQVAEWNGHKHDSIPTTTSWVYLVQYVAGAEAWECTETDAMVFWSMPYSYKLWWQSHGRIDRLNTPFNDLHYYVLMSKAIIDRGVKKSLAAKKTFNESAFATKMGW